MGLPEWCQTHTFLDFLQLTKEPIMNEEVTTEVTQPIPNPVEVAVPVEVPAEGGGFCETPAQEA